VTGKPAVVNVTAGPGAINALNGVFGAFTDSIPMLIVSGQAKRETMMGSYPNIGLRQLGDQETDIVPMIKSITKYACTVIDPKRIRYELERACHLAVSGRPGPCWLDLPIDVQSTMIDETTLEGYSPEVDLSPERTIDVLAAARDVIERLNTAKRPVLLVGTGVRLAGAVGVLEDVAAQLGIPVVTAWTPDLIPSDNPHYCGRQGTIGTRAGNFTVQNADVLVIVGSRMAIRQVSFNWKSFAREAYKIQVDADPAEMKKPTLKPDKAICCDAKVFLETLSGELTKLSYTPEKHREWLEWGRERVQKYPTVQDRQRTTENGINPYFFFETLWRELRADDVVVCGDATACIVPFQVSQIKKGQRLFSNSGCASMGYDLPAAIGAAVARAGKRVICLSGDGSIMMNVQELRTMAHHRFPIILFVLNNGGYASIRSTQNNFFKLLVGEGKESGVSFPDMIRLAEANGLEACRIEGADFGAQLKKVLAGSGPLVCEVMLDPSQPFEPKLSSKRLPDGTMVTAPLEDMAPFLEREEFASNMLVPILTESK
jgi:acetolactate synthase-1/2/3 large subunit